MPASSLLPTNWFTTMPPAEMQGATMHVFHDGRGSILSIVSYIGSTVFQITNSVTRRYDLDSHSKIGPYIRAISKKLKEGGASEIAFEYDAKHPYTSLRDFACGVIDGAFKVMITGHYPTIWANAPWASTTVLKPGEPMENQMKSDADDLLSMLGSNAKNGFAAQPASDPPDPTPHVEEGDPTSNSTPPHRRSVIKGLRDPKTYLASLTR
jgi:hypothetical protein